MKTININNWKEIPKHFTGIAIWPDGSKFWYIDGKYSRLDGPAIEDTDGYKVWYIDDKRLTFIEFWERQKDTEYAPAIMAYMLGAKK